MAKSDNPSALLADSLTGHDLYRAEQVKQGEKQAATLAKLSLFELMERAGKAIFDLILHEYPNLTSLAVCCGGGNNAGDGYVVAGLAKQLGTPVILYQLGSPNRLSGDAKKAMQQWQSVGGAILSANDALIGSKVDRAQASQSLSHCDVIVDAILGTGLHGSVREPEKQLIEIINASSPAVVSVDLPSGLCADTGNALGASIEAEHTVTFIGRKQGLYTGQARDFTGQIHFAGLGVDQHFKNNNSANTQTLDGPNFLQQIMPRSPTAHKGQHGKLLCIGGNEGMSGAITLAATAAARTGAGLICALTHPDSMVALQVSCPEVMCAKWRGDTNLLVKRSIWANVLLLGPGLGRGDWSWSAFHALVGLDKNKVFDADALTLLSIQPDYDERRIITPHSGEAARLLDVAVAQVEADRFQAVQALQARYGGVAILKGPGTLVCDGKVIYVCQQGNAGMASGGMGDVLAGVIASLLAQGVPLLTAAAAGVYLHSAAADIAAQGGQKGMLASDLLPILRTLING